MNDFNEIIDQFTNLYAEPFTETLAVAAIGFVLYIIVCRALNKLTTRGYLEYRLRILLGNIIRWLIIIIVALLGMGFFGLSVGTLWATLSGVLALVALGFVAVWSVLSNVLCSVLLIVFPPFRIGDCIEIQEPTSEFNVKGKVKAINMLFTSLEVMNQENDEVDNILRIPNNIFFQKYIRVIPGESTESLRRYTARQADKNQ